MCKEINVFNKKIIVNLFDFSGHENFIAPNKLIYQILDIIIIAFDITDLKSFDNVENWRNEVIETTKFPNIAICGCKCDLIEEKNEEEKIEKIKKYCKKNGFPLYFTSSKYNKGINEMIEDLVKKILKINNDEEQRKKFIVKDIEQNRAEE